MIKLSSARLCAALAIVLALAAAAHPLHAAAAPAALDAALAQARNALARSDYAAAADAYERAAQATDAAFAADYYLLAGETAMMGHQPAHAAVILDHMGAPKLDPHQTARYQLLAAGIALARNDPAAALKYLPAQPADPTLAPELLLVRAQALFATGAATAATATLVQREKLLPPALAAADRAEIWKGLSRAPATSLGTARAGNADEETRGWLQLAALARANAPLEAYKQWHQQYPDHPGNALLASLLAPGGAAAGAGAASLLNPTVPGAAPGAAPSAMPGAMPGAGPGAFPGTAAASFGAVPLAPAHIPAVAATAPVALLLPLTGPLSAAGTAVRDAFVAQQPAQAYDTGDTPQTAADAYRQAVAAGAGLIVGPMRKEDADAILTAGPPGVPLLLLNQVDSTTQVPDNVLQFALSPEDEARAAAEDAATHGLHRAVALVQQGEWGEQVLAAFRNRFEALQGTVVDSAEYDPSQQDYSDIIKPLLKYQASIDRFHTLRSLLGVRMEFTPRRRADIDFIFIAARAPQARLIAAQFRFYRADDLPIYATSSAYDGTVDLDVRGLRFCDVPAVVNGNTAGRAVDLVRLDALGHDAGQLSTAMRAGQLNPAVPIDGATGVLTVGPGNIVHRHLGCAEIGADGVRPLSASNGSAGAPGTVPQAPQPQGGQPPAGPPATLEPQPSQPAGARPAAAPAPGATPAASRPPP